MLCVCPWDRMKRVNERSKFNELLRVLFVCCCFMPKYRISGKFDILCNYISYGERNSFDRHTTKIFWLIHFKYHHNLNQIKFRKIWIQLNFTIVFEFTVSTIDSVISISSNRNFIFFPEEFFFHNTQTINSMENAIDTIQLAKKTPKIQIFFSRIHKQKN